ncbi:hypothetical protein KEJ13_09100 [Candidatus Bathyarchaeota archaeon]|nr:hypothetical protein [Candidatus Bathyarchaeota archaeon]
MHETRYTDLIGYMDFPNDYIEIIKEKWEIFEPMFQYKSRVIDDLKVLEPLRHHRGPPNPQTPQRGEKFL